ncbi:MAG: hypothetical protein ACYSUI_24910, partial [Planctomycetota bacterium]
FAIPIVNDDITRFNPPSLTGLGLYPDLGGTSGGWFDLETGTAGRTLPGSHFVLSKTPGQGFPGLYAGYLIQGQIDDLKTPYFNNVKDDIADAALKRAQELGPLTEERVADGLFTDPRRLMTYGSRNDKKNAITTSLHRSLRFAIETDPPGLDAVEFRAALRVREQPRSVEDSTDLIVTTQSDGWEDLQKLGYDTVIEVIKEAIATAVLTVLTGGSYLEACGTSIGQEVRDAVLGAAEEFVVDAIGAEVLHSEDYFGVEQTPLYGRRLNPLLSYKAINPDLLAGNKAPIALKTTSELRKLLKRGSQRRQALEIVEGQAKGLVNFCAVLKKPFSAAADAVKDLVPRESLGGGGAARATAIKILAVEIPMDATSDPKGTNIAWFQLDQAVMITPDESNVHDISLVPALPFDDRADSMTVRELVRTLHSEFDRLQPGSAEYNDAQFNAVSAVLGWIRSPQSHVVKRIPNEALSGQLGIDTYEDYRVRIASLPALAVTVTPNGTVSDFKLTTGQTVIPVTTSSIVSALRSNQNASARASLRSNGFDMFPIAATIPGPNDP